MKLKTTLVAAALAGGLAWAAMPAMAAAPTGLGLLKGVGAQQSTGIEHVAIWAGRCHWGFGGYHKWVPGVGRVQCTARKCWTNSLGFRRCRWF